MMQLLKPLRLSARVSIPLLLIRLVVGLAFMFHGYSKIRQPFGWMGPDATIPPFFQALAALAEFGGGLAWMLGVLTPLASFGLTCTMAVAVWMTAMVFHLPFVAQKGGGAVELPATFLCVALLLLLAGPGRFSLDRVLFGERGAPAPDPEPGKPAG
ncbi:MAG TPA: DoxX family protein [Candidatus Paceibacterota bacterium]|nr:DoxX family protein [Verrucomicrobiota bacterium]HSA09343.1 DoxX family protein [Candidatus Paceibacterota bacterium]